MKKETASKIEVEKVRYLIILNTGKLNIQKTQRTCAKAL
jgi:hypothetical protein